MPEAKLNPEAVATPASTSRVAFYRNEGPGLGGLGDLNLLTADDVCALLKVKKSWLYDAVEAGMIQVIRLGKQLRFQPSAISDYLARCSGTAPSAGPVTGSLSKAWCARLHCHAFVWRRR